MKIRLTYKFPDAIYEAVREAQRDDPSIDRDELTDELIEIMGSSEYVFVEVDTETKTKRIL